MWNKIAEFDTESDVTEYEEAEKFQNAIEEVVVSGELRTIGTPVDSESEYWHLEEKSEESGWGKVAEFTDANSGFSGEKANEFADVIEDTSEYRVVFLYDDDEYVIERYYDNE